MQAARVKAVLLGVGLLSACSTIDPHKYWIDKYGLYWETSPSEEKKTRVIEVWVSDETFWNVCQPEWLPAEAIGQACAVRYSAPLIPDCVKYYRKTMRYTDLTYTRWHEQQHCDGYRHLPGYLHGILDSWEH